MQLKIGMETGMKTDSSETSARLRTLAPTWPMHAAYAHAA